MGSRPVAQRPQAQYHRRTALRPFHRRATQPLLDDHLARRLRHPAADRLIRRHPPGVVHPARPTLVGEVGERIRFVGDHLEPSLTLRKTGRRNRLSFQPQAGHPPGDTSAGEHGRSIQSGFAVTKKGDFPDFLSLSRTWSCAKKTAHFAVVALMNLESRGILIVRARA
jgi:hypothetical protein